MKIHKFIVTQASPEVLFACISEAELIPQWMEEIESIHFPVPIDPLQPIGTRFTQRIREGIGSRTYEGVVKRYEEFERFAIDFTDRRFQFSLEYRIVVDERGTCLYYKLENRRENLLTLLAGGLVAGMTEQMVVKNLRNLKRFAEERSGR